MGLLNGGDQLTSRGGRFINAGGQLINGGGQYDANSTLHTDLVREGSSDEQTPFADYTTSYTLTSLTSVPSVEREETSLELAGLKFACRGGLFLFGAREFTSIWFLKMFRKS
eukprot:1186021-Prorocentrum_minimum.AAC.2